MYAAADGWRPGAHLVPVSNELDRWILSRLQRLIAAANSAFQNYEHFRLIEAFQIFDDEFSNWYLRRSRRRFWRSDSEAYQTLYLVLTTVIRVMAPVLPVLTEEISQNLVRSADPSAPESVHLTSYPQVDASLIDEALEQSIDAVIRVKNLALHLRTQSKVKIRQPLSTLYVRPRDAADRSVLANPEYAAQILDEANLKGLKLIEDQTALVSVRLRPNAQKLRQRAGKHMRAIAQALEQADPKEGVKGVTLQIDGQPFELSADEILVSYEGPPNLTSSFEQGTFMALDISVTPELMREGMARDFNRLVQDQRKALNLDISDRITVRYSASPRVVEAITEHVAYLRNELLAERLETGADPQGSAKLSLNGEEIFVTIDRV